MKKLLLLIVFILLWLAARSFAGDSHTLAGVLQPQMIQADHNELFVVEGATVWIYGTDHFEPIMQIGRKGEGPGELKVTNTWYNTVSVGPEAIFIDGLDKVLYFTRRGRLSKELKKPYGIYQTRPVGDHFVGMKQLQMEDKTQYQSVILYDSAFQPIKELAKQKSPVQSVAATTEVIPDILNFWVYRDRIYVEMSREGFRIAVFNSEGELEYRIEKNIPPNRISESDRQDAIKKLQQDPFVKQIGWEAFKGFSKLVFPETFPPIQNIIVDQDRIFVQTFKNEKCSESWMVLDLQGHLIKETRLPRVDRATFMARLLGVTYSTIHRGKFYFLKEDEETETWEIHVVEI